MLKRRSLAWLLLALAGAAAAQTLPPPAPGQYALSGPPNVAALTQTIKSAVQAAGGNLESRNIHLVVAFATGFYSSDPIAAQASRQAATELSRKLLVAQDTVSARAWELTTWAFRPASETTLTLAADDRAGVSQAVSKLWPQTAREGSTGGHDTERAIAELTTELGAGGDAVIVLLSNTAASVGPDKGLMGENAAEYEHALEGWSRAPGAHGASAVVPYTVRTPSGKLETQDLEAVVLTPKAFTSTPVSGPTRSERIAGVKNAVPVNTGTGGGTGALIAVLVLIALAAAGFAAYRLLIAPKRKWRVEVDGQSFPVQGPEGKVVCVIAGPGFENANGDPVYLTRVGPSEAYAKVTCARGGVGVKVAGTHPEFPLKERNGEPHFDAVTLNSQDPDANLTFEGQVRSSTGALRTQPVAITFTLAQGEA